MWCPVQVAALSRQLPMSCSDPRDLTLFTLCLKTRQSVCCLSESKVSGIWLIIYMTFRKSGSDLLSSFCPLWLFLSFSPPVLTQTVNGEFITSSRPIIFRMKRIYISFITLYHSATTAASPSMAVLIFYCIDVVTRKAWNIAGISLFSSRLAADNSPKHTGKIGLDCETGVRMMN